MAESDDKSGSWHELLLHGLIGIIHKGRIEEASPLALERHEIAGRALIVETRGSWFEALLRGRGHGIQDCIECMPSNFLAIHIGNVPA